MPFAITPGELEYQANLALVGVTYKVFLATTGSLTLTSSLSAWEAAELTASNGYQAVTGTVGSGSYDAVTKQFLAPTITGQFSAVGAGYSFDAMVVKLANRTKPYAINLYGTSVITLAAGQSRGFSFTLGNRA